MNDGNHPGILNIPSPQIKIAEPLPKLFHRGAIIAPQRSHSTFAGKRLECEGQLFQGFEELINIKCCPHGQIPGGWGIGEVNVPAELGTDG